MTKLGLFGIIVTIIGTFFGAWIGGYQSGQSSASDTTNEITVNVENSIQNAVSNLPQEKKDAADDIVAPLLELITAISHKNAKDNKTNITALESKVTESLSKISLVSYKADASPFVPPLEMVQFLCEDRITFAYMGVRRSQNSSIRIKVNGSTSTIYPGDVKIYSSDSARLQLTYLEYKKEMKGPVLKYECI